MKMIRKNSFNELLKKVNELQTIDEMEKWIANQIENEQEQSWRMKDFMLALRILEKSESVTEMIERIQNSTEFHGVDWDMLGNEYEINEVERMGTFDYSSINSKVPNAPFGFLNSLWERIKEMYIEGDKLFDFSSQTIDWENCAGQSGYCLVRGNKILQVMTLMRS
jgi:hypothetical protein